ncbi:GyrI-like domain-containing protein [Marinomonas epiphytica]
MQIVKIEKAKTIVGLRVRTNNQNEMQADTAKIGTLHANFAEQVAVDYSQGEPLYGVYYQYESDHQGDFSVLVGSNRSCLTTEATLETVTLEAGKYLVFSGKGEMPQTVINVWQKIWRYFATQRPTINAAIAQILNAITVLIVSMCTSP